MTNSAKVKKRKVASKKPVVVPEAVDTQVSVFVYGTLKQGFPLYEHWMLDSTYIQPACVSGYTLFDLGPYPAMIKLPESCRESCGVQGEVFSMPSKDFNALASMEKAVGYDVVTVCTDDGALVSAFVMPAFNEGLARWNHNQSVSFTTRPFA